MARIGELGGKGTPTHKPLFGDPWSHNGVTVRRTSQSRVRRAGGRTDVKTGTRNVGPHAAHEDLGKF